MKLLGRVWYPVVHVRQRNTAVHRHQEQDNKKSVEKYNQHQWPMETTQIQGSNRFRTNGAIILQGPHHVAEKSITTSLCSDPALIRMDSTSSRDSGSRTAPPRSDRVGGRYRGTPKSAAADGDGTVGACRRGGSVATAPSMASQQIRIEKQNGRERVIDSNTVMAQRRRGACRWIGSRWHVIDQ